jgi:hypothetical protein
VSFRRREYLRESFSTPLPRKARTKVVYDAAPAGTLIEGAQPMCAPPRHQVSTLWVDVRVRSRGSAIATI